MSCVHYCTYYPAINAFTPYCKVSDKNFIGISCPCVCYMSSPSRCPGFNHRNDTKYRTPWNSSLHASIFLFVFLFILKISPLDLFQIQSLSSLAVETYFCIWVQMKIQLCRVTYSTYRIIKDSCDVANRRRRFCLFFHLTTQTGSSPTVWTTKLRLTYLMTVIQFLYILQSFHSELISSKVDLGVVLRWDMYSRREELTTYHHKELVTKWLRIAWLAQRLSYIRARHRNWRLLEPVSPRLEECLRKGKGHLEDAVFKK
jgi:hypothetical protein